MVINLEAMPISAIVLVLYRNSMRYGGWG